MNRRATTERSRRAPPVTSRPVDGCSPPRPQSGGRLWFGGPGLLFKPAPLIGPYLTIDQSTNGAEPSEPAQISSGCPRRLHASIPYSINFLHYFPTAATVPF